MPRPKAPNFAFAKQIVARKNFVGAFAREHNFDACIAHEFGQEVERRWCRAQQGALGMLHHERDRARDVFTPNHELVVIGAKSTRNEPLVRRFVVFGIVKTNRECRKS
jgi:hypothetical protein